IVSDPFEDETEVDYTGKTIDDVININHLVRYSTVHDAIADAVPGDSIFVPAGTFQVPEKETIPANIVLKGKATGNTKLLATEGFVLGGVLQDAIVLQSPTYHDGEPWTTRATGVELLENSALKNVSVYYYYTGISAEKTTGILIDGSKLYYNHFGAKFTGGVAVTLNNFLANVNEVYGIGFFQGPDAIPENKPTFTGTLSMMNNWSTQCFNAWDDEYIINPLGENVYNTAVGIPKNSGALSDYVYERNPDISSTPRDIPFYLGNYVAKNIANISNLVDFKDGLCGIDIDGDMWGTKNETASFSSDYLLPLPHNMYQWNGTAQWTERSSMDAWDSTWTGFDTPSTSDIWNTTIQCPSGWRLPTKAEVEHMFSLTTVSSESYSGSGYSGTCYRYDYNGCPMWFNKSFYFDETGAIITGDGYYWTSESSPTDPTKAIAYHSNTIVEMPRAAALMVRCIHKKLQSDGTWQ
ncbi:MAG: hypothetical protein LBR06_04425, partial [Bacteroidales bacterium]|nr:hypothetical protein [Bacteroidales bacterium]